MVSLELLLDTITLSAGVIMLGFVSFLVIDDVRYYRRLRPPIGSEIDFLVDQSPPVIDANTGISKRTIAWTNPHSNIIHLDNAQNLVSVFASAVISGETIHLALFNIREYAAAYAIDELNLHEFENIFPYTIDECGLFGVDRQLLLD